MHVMSEPTAARAQPPIEQLARPPSVRRADLDMLRVTGMFTVFFVHVAQVFSPWQTWHIENAERSVWAGQVNLFAFPWVMPLFMFLAGAGAYMSLGHRSNGEYVRDRTVRLVLPFIIGTLVLVPPQIWVERLAEGRTTDGFLAFYPDFFECCYPEGNLAAGHLWFIAYLWVYAVLSLPLLRWLGSGNGLRSVRKLAAVGHARGGILWLFIPVALSQVALRADYPQSLTLINDWANHAVLFIAYVYGFMLTADRELLAAARREWRIALVPAVIASVWLAVYAARTTVPGILPLPWTPAYFMFWTLFGVASWSWIVVAVGASHAAGRNARPGLEYISRAIYPFYMLHQTVIVLSASIVVLWPIRALPKFIVLFVLSLALTVALTELVRRWRPARVALGMRSRA
jgi:surface polysaccharide O-acyltransferase-like enzyme